MSTCIVERFKVVDASAGPVTTNGGVTCDYVSLKNAVNVTVLAKFTQAVGHATVLALTQATAVAGTSVKAVTVACPIWMNSSTAASDTLVAQTAAVSQALTTGAAKHMVVMQLDPATLDQANGFDCLGATVSDSSQATNFVDITYIIETRYPQATPPAAITD